MTKGESAVGTYQVVMNDEEQYSIWPQGTELPSGWRVNGPSGSREECLAHIDEVWTDMRPRGLRERMARATGTA
ncbi:MbtH family protein [Lentzea kentuckyensis]|uniref:MbtH family protein n=1 Tax=Lentzea kentuckyensis TaxID=360086 RepID=UPI000A3A55A9|nr:MbtH family NRPS accessory protein [Lentzea kentuckyensis]